MEELGPYLDYDDEQYERLLCCRYFMSLSSLYQYCEETSRHEWCEECRQVYVSAHLRTCRTGLDTPLSSPPASDFGASDDHQEESLINAAVAGKLPLTITAYKCTKS